MKLYISTEMLAVFSLREVELSRRIHCFLAGERERFYSILFPPPPLAFPPHPSAGSCNFPHRTFLFFIAYFFALYVPACILYLTSKPNCATLRWGLSQPRLWDAGAFPFASWDERISTGANVAFDRAKVRAEFNSSFLSSLITSPNGPETFLFY